MNAPELTCIRCGTPLSVPAPLSPDPASAAQEGSPVTCPGCGRTLTVFRFPALARRCENAALGHAAQHGEAACFHHADRQAEAVCESCGRFLCGLCRIDFNSQTLCPACLALTQTAAEAHIPRRMRYDKLAMLAILVSPFIYCLSIFNACFTLFLCIRHWKTPLSVLPYNRWRFVVAGLLATGVLTLWLALGVFMVTQIVRHNGQRAESPTSETRRTHAR